VGRTSDVVIGVAIQAVPKRQEMALTLAERMGAPVIWDHHGEGVWPTVKRAWRKAASLGDIALVLEDDGWPCVGFEEAVPEILGLLGPRRLIVFRSFRKCQEQAREKGKAWAVTPDGAAGGATMIPSYLVEPFIGWADRYIPQHQTRMGDEKLALFAFRHGLTFWHTCPSIISHESGPSTIGGWGGRHPVWEVDDCTDVDWKAGLDDPVAGSYGSWLVTAAKWLPTESGLWARLQEINGRKR
jgi:hypothetical protein